MARNSIITATITGDASSFNRAVNDADRGLGNFGRNASRVFGGLAVGFAGATAVAVPLVNAASDLNESMSRSGEVFGDASADIEAWSKTTAEAFGISQTAALTSASDFAAFGKAAELTGDDLSNFSKDMVEAAADVASFNNISIDEALQKLRSGLAGEAEPLRQLGVLMSAAEVEAKALEMGLVGVNGEVDEASKVMARQALILEQLGSQGALGDFARTSDGLANQQRILQARFADVTAELGQKLLPIAIDVMSWALDMFDAAENLADVLSDKGVAGVVSMLADEFEWLQPIIEYLSWTVDNARQTWEIFGDDILRYVQRAFAGIADVFEGFITTTRGWIDFFSAIVNGEWSDAFEAMKDIAAGILQTVEGLFELAFAAVALHVTTAFQALDELLGGWPSKIAGFAGDVFAAAINLGKALIDGIVSGIRAAPGALVDAIESLIPGGGIVGDIVGKAGGLFGDVPSLGGVPSLSFGGGGSVSTDAFAASVPIQVQVQVDGRTIAEANAEANRRSGGVLFN